MGRCTRIFRRGEYPIRVEYFNAKTPRTPRTVRGGMSDTLEKSTLRESNAEIDRLANLVIGCDIEVHRHLGPGYAEDVVADCLIVELKAVSALAPVHTAQVKAYLKATGLQLGLLINFNV